MAARTSTRKSKAAKRGSAVGGVAVGSLGTLVFAVLDRNWDVAIAVGTTIAPGLLTYLVANGGIKGVVVALWKGRPSRAARQTA